MAFHREPAPETYEAPTPSGNAEDFFAVADFHPQHGYPPPEDPQAAGGYWDAPSILQPLDPEAELRPPMLGPMGDGVHPELYQARRPELHHPNSVPPHLQHHIQRPLGPPAVYGGLTHVPMYPLDELDHATELQAQFELREEEGEEAEEEDELKVSQHPGYFVGGYRSERPPAYNGSPPTDEDFPELSAVAQNSARSVAPSAPAAPPPEVKLLCRDFLQGRCAAWRCPFSHDIQGMPCRFGFACKRLDTCPFDHDPEAQLNNQVLFSSLVPVCRFWKRGQCIEGNRCTFRQSVAPPHRVGDVAVTTMMTAARRLKLAVFLSCGSADTCVCLQFRGLPDPGGPASAAAAG